MIFTDHDDMNMKHNPSNLCPLSTACNSVALKKWEKKDWRRNQLKSSNNLVISHSCFHLTLYEIYASPHVLQMVKCIRLKSYHDIISCNIEIIIPMEYVFKFLFFKWLVIQARYSNDLEYIKIFRYHRKNRLNII